MNAHYPSAPGWKSGSPETAVAAAISVAEEARTVRLKCLRFVRQQGGYGATAEEGADAIGLSNHYAGRPRFSELRAAGLIVDSGNRRTGRSGRSAVVWVAVAEGEANG